MGKTWYQPLVAVSALLWRGDEVLFLRRARPPLWWVPPGGRMEAGEEPLGALRREVREETGLTELEIVAPCIVAAEQYEGQPMLFLDFACAYAGGAIRLDPAEHDAWRWLHLEELARAETETLSAGGIFYTIYRWGAAQLTLSHSLEQLRLSRRVLDCLRAQR